MYFLNLQNPLQILPWHTSQIKSAQIQNIFNRLRMIHNEHPLSPVLVIISMQKYLLYFSPQKNILLKFCFIFSTKNDLIPSL
jgi:hypothetical protein